jgi:hypothetical protein
MISYSSPDGQKVETVRVAIAGLALRATGYIVSPDAPAYGASYSIVVGNDGQTRRITVRCDDVRGERSLSLTRSPGAPWIAETVSGSAPQPALADAVDIYISGSAFSASLPIRRVGLQSTVGSEGEVTVASIALPDLTLAPVVHRGRTEAVSEDGAEIDYTGSYGHRKVWVDAEGILTGTEGLTERIS